MLYISFIERVNSYSNLPSACICLLYMNICSKPEKEARKCGNHTGKSRVLINKSPSSLKISMRLASVLLVTFSLAAAYTSVGMDGYPWCKVMIASCKSGKHHTTIEQKQKQYINDNMLMSHSNSRKNNNTTFIIFFLDMIFHPASETIIKTRQCSSKVAWNQKMKQLMSFQGWTWWRCNLNWNKWNHPEKSNILQFRKDLPLNYFTWIFFYFFRIQEEEIRCKFAVIAWSVVYLEYKHIYIHICIYIYINIYITHVFN